MYYEQPTDILFKTQALFWSTCLVSGIASLILAGMKSLVAININKIYFRYVFKYLSNTFANIFGNVFCLFAKFQPERNCCQGVQSCADRAEEEKNLLIVLIVLRGKRI